MPDAEIREQLDRILDYGGLQSSVRRREMLKFIVEETLAGRALQIKATTIAIAVFGRSADFDQQSDPVVRLEARKLRQDLDNYYVGVGQDDPIRISIPKGHYRPKFSPNAASEPGATPVPVDEADPPETNSPATQNSTSSWRWPALAASLLIAAFALVYFVAAGNRGSGSAPVTGATIRVEGFEVRGEGELPKFLAAGLSQEIAAALLTFPDLKVHFTPAGQDTPREGSETGSREPATEYLVTGAVWQDGDDVMVRSVLTRAADGEVLWAGRFTENARTRSISSIETDISSEIATIAGQRYGLVQNDVRAKLLSDSDDPSLSAYACVARAQIYQRTYSDEEYTAARRCLEETVLREPEYARAWGMLAILRNDAARFGYDPDRTKEEGFVHAREAAARALAIDPEEPDALKAMSHIEQYSGNLDRSIEWAQKAVDANPNDPTSLANLGYRLGIVNRFPEAVPLLERAIDRSVSPPPFYFHMIAMDRMMQEDWTGMLAPATSAVADSSSISYGLAAIAHGRLGNARAAADYHRKMSDRWPLLAENPRTALQAHQLDPAVIDAFAEGLEVARGQQPG
ncbi:hypothetical protein R5H30_00375 [Sulfitobacter sp. D35]|uniref:hypothetical protein n=1 Tax=Sulfitobacter sp. D35 TaxID=3083252 RepID=UPI00296F1311|nr:hypothetical protein [Sulfitobacter sp. D35]MDW4496418.1 hypothetical protein [Sulfitobacter sp. D35]